MHTLSLQSKGLLVALMILMQCAFASSGTSVLHGAHNLGTPPLQRAKPHPTAKNHSRLKNAVLQIKAKVQKEGKGAIAIVVVASILLVLLLGFGVFLLAWGGATATTLVVTGALGLGLILFAAGRVIRSIKRKNGIARMLRNVKKRLNEKAVAA